MMKSLCIRAAVLWAALAVAAFAQEYPAKSVRVIVPWAAGGSTDSISRILAAKLTEYTGQQFIIDNRAGATGTIGHALVSKSPPDGYTLLIGSNSTFAIAPHLYKSLQYDNDAAFAPIELLAVSPQILSVHPSIPVKNVRELIALAKAQPGALVFSSAGPGSTKPSRDRAADEYRGHQNDPRARIKAAARRRRRCSAGKPCCRSST